MTTECMTKAQAVKLADRLLGNCKRDHASWFVKDVISDAPLRSMYTEILTADEYLSHRNDPEPALVLRLNALCCYGAILNLYGIDDTFCAASLELARLIRNEFGLPPISGTGPVRRLPACLQVHHRRQPDLPAL